jgi:YHS domain-containing protein
VDAGSEERTGRDDSGITGKWEEADSEQMAPLPEPEFPQQSEENDRLPPPPAQGTEPPVPRLQLGGALQDAGGSEALGPTLDQEGNADVGEDKMGGKTAQQWAQEQAEFAHLPPLPEGWIRVKSQTTGKIYFFNMHTGKTTFTEPTDLPPGWVQMKSRSTGQPYYWNANLKKSQFERPLTEEG